MTTVIGTLLTETNIAVGLLIPDNIANDSIEIVNGIVNITEDPAGGQVILYYQADLNDNIEDFEGEGLYANNKKIDEEDQYYF